jgi:hypothetical protein
VIRVEFIPPSDEELIDAYIYYADQLKGLEHKFLDELEETIEILKQYPEAWIKVGGITRRCLLKRFPYFILYIYENDSIYITCIAHLHRNPEYYISRLL